MKATGSTNCNTWYFPTRFPLTGRQNKAADLTRLSAVLQSKRSPNFTNPLGVTVKGHSEKLEITPKFKLKYGDFDSTRLV